MPHKGIGLEDSEALSGSFATVLTTQPSMENFSGTLSVTGEDEQSSLTVVPVVSNVALTAAAATADQQASSSRRRLFFAQALAEATEEQIRTFFSQYGTVEQVQLYNNGSNAGCGYITMATDEQAAAALTALQENPQLPSPVGYVNVSWPIQEEPVSAASAGATGGSSPLPSLAANADRTVFFAKVPPTALASEVELLFGSFGKLAEVNLFRAWAGAKHSKGCGLITYVDRAAAASAIAQLHGKYVFPGSDCPMVVEWIDLKKQRPIAPAPRADKPPLGCAHDAYKLLLSNVPLSVCEADLATLLRQFGHVVQLQLAADATGATASGHVWYATKQAADALQSQVSSQPIWLRDQRTQTDLALGVKRSRKPGMPGMNGGMHVMGHMPMRSSVTPNGATMSSSSNSSSSLLPVLHTLSGSGDMSGQVMQMQAAHSARLAAAATGMDVSMLSSDVIRLLPLQQVSGNFAAGQMQQQQQHVGPGGYVAAEMCEAMLDVYDSAGMGLGMPVHLQPSIAAQMASNLNMQRVQQRTTANSQMCVLPTNMMHTSGQHCVSSPANIMGGFDEFEGSFNMSMVKGMNRGMNLNGNAGMQATQVLSMGQQQQVAAAQANGMLWQRQQQQQQVQQQPQMMAAVSQPLQQQQHMLVLPHSSTLPAGGQMQMMTAGQQLHQQPQMQQQQRASQAGSGSAGGQKSVAVPIEPYEVHLIAEHLMFFANRSGAQVTITSLPGSSSLCIMITGLPNQIATAQQLLAAARNPS